MLGRSPDGSKAHDQGEGGTTERVSGGGVVDLCSQCFVPEAIDDSGDDIGPPGAQAPATRAKKRGAEPPATFWSLTALSRPRLPRQSTSVAHIRCPTSTHLESSRRVPCPCAECFHGLRRSLLIVAHLGLLLLSTNSRDAETHPLSKAGYFVHPVSSLNTTYSTPPTVYHGRRRRARFP